MNTDQEVFDFNLASLIDHHGSNYRNRIFRYLCDGILPNLEPEAPWRWCHSFIEENPRKIVYIDHYHIGCYVDDDYSKKRLFLIPFFEIKRLSFKEIKEKFIERLVQSRLMEPLQIISISYSP